MVMGKNIILVPNLVKTSNPETYISSDDPPFFIEHGTLDPKVPVQQSINFAEDLKKVIGANKVELIILKNAGHGGAAFKTASNLNTVFDFLNKYVT
jgi:dipeptidyl aminopeptidase/acylaminoacyl peptidase